MSRKNKNGVENEIYLADIVAVIYRRRWMILGGAVIGLLLALVAGLLETPKYEYSARIEIGRLYSVQKEADGNLGRALALLQQQNGPATEKYGFRYVEWPESVVDHLRATAFKVYDQMFVNKGRQPGFSVQRDFKSSFEHVNRELEDTTIVEADLKAPKDARAVEFLNATMQALIDEHEQIMKAHIGRLERDVQRMRTRLETLADNQNGLQRRLAGLEQEKALLEGQIDKSMERLTKLQDMAAKDINDPMYLVLVNSEINETRGSINGLRGRLLSDIPEARHKLQLELGHVRDETARVEDQIESAQSAKTISIETRVVSSATSSEDRIAPIYSLYGVLGLLAGLFLALFVTLMLEFWRHNKTRITGKPAQ